MLIIGKNEIYNLQEYRRLFILEWHDEDKKGRTIPQKQYYKVCVSNSGPLQLETICTYETREAAEQAIANIICGIKENYGCVEI